MEFVVLICHFMLATNASQEQLSPQQTAAVLRLGI